MYLYNMNFKYYDSIQKIYYYFNFRNLILTMEIIENDFDNDNQYLENKNNIFIDEEPRQQINNKGSLRKTINGYRIIVFTRKINTNKKTKSSKGIYLTLSREYDSENKTENLINRFSQIRLKDSKNIPKLSVKIKRKKNYNENDMNMDIG